MATALNYIPNVIDAGTTVKYTRTYGDYPAGTWTATLTLAGPSAALTVNAAQVGATSAFLYTITAAQTAARLPGTYTWLERVTETATGEVKTADWGTLEVLPNVATAIAGALQPEPEKRVAVIQAAINGVLTDGMRSYSIYGRSVENLTLDELHRALSIAMADLRAYQNAGTFGPTVRAVFTGPESEL